ncbi:MAG TPA: hypothetical protein VGO52_22080 [Hyphomonadaceae bacterium]|nr:hypothetical protein [Hyphomonadaceae bacterium]
MRKRIGALLAVCVLAACSPAPGPAPKPASILLFNGAGVSPGDVAAIEAVLKARGLDYATANSRQLDAMSAADLKAYRLLIMSGGNFVKMGQGLVPGTSATIRQSVNGGLNYLGVCAGAFLAGDSPPNRLYNGFNITGGVRFPFYALSAQGVRKAAVKVQPVGAPAADHYWEDGPELSGWGDVVARYENGTPAVVEGKAGEGFVVLAGIHPEAPESWRRGLVFATPASADHAYAAQLVDAALNGEALPHD